MTTIAYDGITLAVDSQLTSNTLVFGNVNKIMKLRDGCYFVGAGEWEGCCAIALWLNGGEKPTIKEEESVLGVLIEKGKVPFEITGALSFYPMCIPWAGGSGQQIAMTAMKCGKTAKEAVQLACKLDIYTGGRVRTVTL